MWPSKDVVGNRFKIGVGVSHRVLTDPSCAELICKHFQILTPENCMKPQGIHPAEDQWNFGDSDRSSPSLSKMIWSLSDTAWSGRKMIAPMTG